MGYLDDLKKQSEAIRQQEEQQSSQESEETRAARELKPAMQAIHEYLKEATEVLNSVKPDVPVDYEIMGFGPLNNLNQGNYTLSVDDHENVQKLTVRFECAHPNADPRVLNVKGRNEYITHRDYLWRNNFQFKDKFTMDGGSLYLEPKIIVRLEFTPEVKQRKIRLDIRNLLEIGVTTRWIEPKDATHDKLDELTGLILRKTRDLEMLSTGQMTDEMRQRIKEGLRKEQEKRRRMEVLAAAEQAAEEQARAEDKLVSKLKKNIGGLVKRR